MQFIVQQWRYYVGGKGYDGATCQGEGVNPRRIYPKLGHALKAAADLTKVNDTWSCVRQQCNALTRWLKRSTTFRTVRATSPKRTVG